MSEDVWRATRLALTVPSVAAGAAAVAVAWLNRRRKPRAARLYAAGVLVLLGRMGAGELLWRGPGWMESVISAGVHFYTADVLWTAYSAAADLAACGLVTAAVFLPEPDPGPRGR